MMKETITLQLGNHSNYVGQHYWNLQNEQYVRQHSLNGDNDGGEEGSVTRGRDRLYRYVSDNSRVSYVPRVVLCDLMENVGKIFVTSEDYISFLRPHTAGEKIDQYDDVDEEGYNQSEVEWDGTVSRVDRDEGNVHPFQIFLDSMNAVDMENNASDKYNASAMNEKLSAGGAESEELPRPDDLSIRKWTDYSHLPYHPKSIQNLPQRCHSTSFDSFTSYMLHKDVTTSFVEDYMDSVRYFAEECDSLSTIQVFADAHDGFAGLTDTILHEIRDEYGRVSVPVWTFTDNGLSSSIKSGSEMNAKATLKNLGVPYMYASIAELATAVIPVSPLAALQACQERYHVSDECAYYAAAITAMAIEGVLGVDYHQESRSTSVISPYLSEVLHFATLSHRLPFVAMESFLPLQAEWSHLHNEVHSYYSSLSASDSIFGSSRAAIEGRAALTQYKNNNPFLISLSPTVYGPWSAIPKEGIAAHEQQTLTNVLCMRGVTSDVDPDLASFLFSQVGVERVDGRYLLSRCIQCQSAVHLPVSYPEVLRPTTAGAVSMTHARAVGITSLGANRGVSMHVDGARALWHSASSRGSIRAQLAKVGVDIETAQNIEETLANVVSNYGDSANY